MSQSSTPAEIYKKSPRGLYSDTGIIVSNGRLVRQALSRLFRLVLFHRAAHKLADFHKRNHRKRQAYGDKVFLRADGGKLERGIDPWQINDGQRQEEGEYKRAPQVFVLFLHGKHRMFDRTHVEGVEHFRHGQGEKRHRHAVGADALDRPVSAFDKVPDEIGKQGDCADKEALQGDVYPHAAGKNPFLIVARLALHEVVFAVLHAQRQRGKGVRDEVYPQ